jgi:hypothetical protein
MDAIHNGHTIRVYPEASFSGRGTPAKWIFDIYRQSDGKCVHAKGISDSQNAAYAAARKWIDEHGHEK